MATRDYSDIYGVKDFIINELAPQHFEDMADVSLLNVGLLGLVVDATATTSFDNFNTTSRYIQELLPGQSTLPEFIYAQAANFGVTDIFATPATCTAILFIKEDDVIQNGTQNGQYTEYIIDSDMIVYVEDVPFSIPYDIKIRSRYYNGTYNHNCSYVQSMNNSIANIDYPYIRCIKTTIQSQNTSYLALSIKLFQYSRRKITENIITNNKLNIPYVDISFDNMLCNFEVMYTAPNSTTSKQLRKFLTNMPSTTVPFTYYKMADDTTLRLSFTNDDRYFIPEYNSELEIYIYETLGAEGVMPQYKGDDIHVEGKSSEPTLDYNNKVPMFCIITSDSINGEASYTIDELNTITWENQLSLKSYTTDEDLNRYFSSYTAIHGTTAYFIKTRDDFATRQFACYAKLIHESTIFPTNTLPIEINLNKLSTYDPESSRYIIKPGTRFGYKEDSSSMCELLTDDETRDIEYTSVALISVESEPNSVGYYMNSIDKVVPTTYTYTNDNALYQFVIKSFEIKRNAVLGEMKYKISVTILPTDMNQLENTLYDDDYSGDISLEEDIDETEVTEPVETEEKGINIEKISMYLLIDVGTDHYIELKLNSGLSSSETGFIFENTIETDDIINDGTIQLLGMKSVESQEVETFSVDMDNPIVNVLVFYDEGTTATHSYGTAIPDTEKYTLCNIFTPQENELYFAYPLSLMHSDVTFHEYAEEPFFYFTISDVPLFSNKFLTGDTNNIHLVIDELNSMHTYISNAVTSITASFAIHLKFYNTYGKSKIFSIKDGTNLNRTYCSLDLGIKLNKGIDDSCFNDIKIACKSYIEGLNSAVANTISISRLITTLHESFPNEIDSIVFKSFNGYPSDIQLIIMNKDLSASENMKCIPEFLTINTDDITLTTL